MPGERYAGQSPWRRTRSIVVGSAPAAGADWAVTVPAGELWALLSVYAALTADATVASREPVLVFGDGSATFAAYPGQAIVASTTWRSTWAAGTGSAAVGLSRVTGIAAMVLQPGWTIAVETGAIQAGDQWTAPRILANVTTIRGGPDQLAAVPDFLVGVTTTPAT